MPSRKPIRARAGSRKQNRMSRTPMARPITPRPKRKIGRKILLVLILMGIGHAGYRLYANRSGENMTAAPDSVAVLNSSQETVSQQKQSTKKTAESIAAEEGAVAQKVGIVKTAREWVASLELVERFEWLDEWVDRVFVVREVNLAGSLSVPVDTLLARCDTLEGRPVFDLKLYDIAQAISSHPRVKWATVSRRLPSTLQITVRERREEMLVVTSDGLLGIDEENVVLPSPPPGWPLDVPLITGYKGRLKVGQSITDESLLHAADWIRRAKQTPRVLGWMSEVHLGPGGVEWVSGINGWRAHPGGHTVGMQVATLDAYLSQNDAVPARAEQGKQLDLRFPGFLIVRHGS